MSVTAHKYCNISIDERRVTPIRTNVAYQGVNVPAGRHRITMRYRNPLVPLCGAISALAIAALTFVAVRWRNV
jgi:hypothetical protein